MDDASEWAAIIHVRDGDDEVDVEVVVVVGVVVKRVRFIPSYTIKKDAADGADPNRTDGSPAYMPLIEIVCLRDGRAAAVDVADADGADAADAADVVESEADADDVPLWLRAFWSRVLIVSSG